MLPMPSTVATTTSPGQSHSCGVRPAPTPSGVPEAMMSPGSSVMPEEMSAISVVHLEQHVAGVGALLFHAVDGQPEVERLRIGDIVGGDDAGAEGGVGVLALGENPLAGAAVVAGGDVDHHRIAEDMGQGGVAA